MNATTTRRQELHSTGFGTYAGQTSLADGLAKEWGTTVKGYTNRGGCIFSAGGTFTGLRSWRAVWTAHRPIILDWLARSLTGFDSFTALLAARSTYRPTISVSRNWRYLALAVAYDRAQELRKDQRRAYRI